MNLLVIGIGREKDLIISQKISYHAYLIYTHTHTHTHTHYVYIYIYMANAVGTVGSRTCDVITYASAPTHISWANSKQKWAEPLKLSSDELCHIQNRVVMVRKLSHRLNDLLSHRLHRYHRGEGVI